MDKPQNCFSRVLAVSNDQLLPAKTAKRRASGVKQPLPTPAQSSQGIELVLQWRQE
jgi:hypothetical protein